MSETLRARAIAEVALMAGVIVVLGLVPPLYVLGLPVPITAQTLGVMLAGAVLGARRGALAALVVLVLCAASLPVMAGGRGGVGVLLGPTGGYALGFVPGAFVTGLLARRALRLPARTRGFALVGACVLGGVLVVYALGVPWTAAVTGLPLRTTALGALVFIPGDLLKAVLAGAGALAVHRQVRVEQMRPVPSGTNARTGA
ncbi:MAG: biotin transporter BioY [Actinobacteria bacterium]|nr:biotin transporter BioY [Actinomycetota bacterium]MCG2800889.1 biotin transporter BioY [Cellulomonas sp.]